MIWLGLTGPPVNLYIPSQLPLVCMEDKVYAPQEDSIDRCYLGERQKVCEIGSGMDPASPTL